jgi:hypothetical protein
MARSKRHYKVLFEDIDPENTVLWDVKQVLVAVALRDKDEEKL